MVTAMLVVIASLLALLAVTITDTRVKVNSVGGAGDTENSN